MIWAHGIHSCINFMTAGCSMSIVCLYTWDVIIASLILAMPMWMGGCNLVLCSLKQSWEDWHFSWPQYLYMGLKGNHGDVHDGALLMHGAAGMHKLHICTQLVYLWEMGISRIVVSNALWIWPALRSWINCIATAWNFAFLSYFYPLFPCSPFMFFCLVYSSYGCFLLISVRLVHLSHSVREFIFV